jgi:hypothetical protein
MTIFAQAPLGYSLVSLAIGLVVVLAVVALVWVFIRQSGIPIPSWLTQVIGIVILAVVVIIAIKIVAGL